MNKYFEILGSRKTTSERLLAHFPVSFGNARKQELYKKALSVHKNDNAVDVSASRVVADTDCIKKEKFTYNKTEIISSDSFFEYAKDKNSETRKVWWMNFADPELFGYYDSTLFAQDEIQVFEHPLLGCVRTLLKYQEDRNVVPKTIRENFFKIEATPYLIENVPLWNYVNTTPKLSEGRIGNIYGNKFIYASKEEIQNGIQVCKEDIRDNILAISAPYGNGKYSKDDYERIFETLLSSFSAARYFSEGKKCIIHGGNWGCGAFGGNRELMYYAQIFAASVTEIDELVLHGADKEILEKSVALFESSKEITRYDDLISFLIKRKYYWGQSDGN